MKVKDKIIKNIPNVLTFSRLIASVLGAGAFVLGNIPWAIGLYTYGAVSDFLDGFAARSLNAYSEFGRKLDALSDKLYAGSLLVPSILCGNWLMAMPLWLEWKIAQINLKAEKRDFKPKTHRIGKFKTATLFPTIIVGLLATLSPEFYFVLYRLMEITINLQGNTLGVYEIEFNYNVENTSKEDSLNINEDASINTKLKVKKSRLEDKPLNAIGSPRFAFVYKATNYINNANDYIKDTTNYIKNNIDDLFMEGTRYMYLPVEYITSTPTKKKELKR